MNYDLASFIVGLIGITIAIISLGVATGVSIWIFRRNRKNYIFKMKRKINKLSKYITKVQNYNRSLETEEYWQNKNQVFNIFYTIEYLILESINKKINDSKGFIEWKQFNPINKIIKYNKKNIKKYNKYFKKIRNWVKVNDLAIDEFRIILYSDWQGIPFDLYGQFIDNKILKEDYLKEGVENSSQTEYNIVGFRPYNIYKFIDINECEIDFVKINSSIDFIVDNYLNFNLFSCVCESRINQDIYKRWDLERFIKNIRNRGNF